MSLLPICGKIIKTLLFNKIIKFLLKINLFYQISRVLNWVIFALINFYLSLTIFASFDAGPEVRTVFLDISKAFDKVWYDGINFRLTQNGTSRNLLNLLHDSFKGKKTKRSPQ